MTCPSFDGLQWTSLESRYSRKSSQMNVFGHSWTWVESRVTEESGPFWKSKLQIRGPKGRKFAGLHAVTYRYSTHCATSVPPSVSPRRTHFREGLADKSPTNAAERFTPWARLWTEARVRRRAALRIRLRPGGHHSPRAEAGPHLRAGPPRDQECDFLGQDRLSGLVRERIRQHHDACHRPAARRPRLQTLGLVAEPVAGPRRMG